MTIAESTASGSWRMPPKASTPSTTAGRWARSASWAPTASTRRRTTSAARGGPLHQRPRAGRAGRDHPRQGDEPQAVLPRPGGQVHLGRCRLELRPQRDLLGVPVRPARDARRDQRASPQASTSSITARLEPLEAEGLLRLPRVPEECRKQLPPLLHPPARPGHPRRTDGPPADSSGSSPSSTTSRCTPRRWGRPSAIAMGTFP